MSTDAARQWTPPPGRHQVNMGASMTRFLKQRKGIQQTKQNKAMPTSNYYHFKYNFMPESVDTNKPGVVELTTKDIATARVERASHQSDEVHVFRGKEEPAKEVECVLIFDPESGMYTLEKLDSSLILNHEGRGAPKVRQPSASPLPNTPSPAATTSKIDEDELFRELESTLAEDNADDDKDEDIPLSASSRIVASNTRKVEPVRPPPPVISSGKPRPGLKGSTAARPPGGPAIKTKPVKSSPLVPPPKPPVAPSASQPMPPAPAVQRVRSPEKGKAALAHAVEIEEEELEFGQPTRPAKRAKISPPPLALPVSNPSNSAGLSSPGGFANLPGPPAVQDDEDDEDEWDEVTGGDHDANAISGGGDDGSIFGGEPDEGEEINLDEFAAEMDQELLGGDEEEDADGEMDDIFGAVESAPVLKPMSLNQFAGGITVGVDDVDDDYSSSSDESDDD